MTHELPDDVPVNNIERFVEVDKFVYNGVCHSVDCSIIILRAAI